MAFAKTEANIITSFIHPIFHHTEGIRGRFWQILILSEKTITGLRKLLRFVLLVVIRLLFLILADIILERAFCAVNLFSGVAARLESQPSVCGQTVLINDCVQYVYVYKSLHKCICLLV